MTLCCGCSRRLLSCVKTAKWTELSFEMEVTLSLTYIVMYQNLGSLKMMVLSQFPYLTQNSGLCLLLILLHHNCCEASVTIYHWKSLITLSTRLHSQHLVGTAVLQTVIISRHRQLTAFKWYGTLRGCCVMTELLVVLYSEGKIFCTSVGKRMTLFWVRCYVLLAGNKFISIVVIINKELSIYWILF